MSIIERSLQRHRRTLEANPPAPAPAPALDTGVDQTASVTSPTASSPLHGRPTQLDPKVLEDNCILLNTVDDHASRAYKILRTRLLQRLNSMNWQCVGITGTTSGEGKSLTAINLAVALARDVKTHVVLVDVDLQRPSVAARLGIQFDKGLTEYLTGEADLEEVLYQPDIERLAIVPNSPASFSQSELLTSPRMDELLQRLRSAQPRQIVVLDLPPILSSDDVIALAPRIDGMLLVVSQGLTERTVLASAKQVLQDMNLIGVVLNRSEEGNQNGYGYYVTPTKK